MKQRPSPKENPDKACTQVWQDEPHSLPYLVACQEVRGRGWKCLLPFYTPVLPSGEKQSSWVLRYQQWPYCGARPRLLNPGVASGTLDSCSNCPARCHLMEGTNPALLVLPRMTGYFPLFIPIFVHNFRESSMLAHGWGGAWATLGAWGHSRRVSEVVKIKLEFPARAAS